MSCEIKVPKEIKPSQNVLKKAQEFIGKFKIFETVHSVPSLLYFDNRSSAFYLICHVDAKEIAAKSDSDAVLDPNDNEDYKLNRNLYTDTFAYKNMEDDACHGRSFEDIVVEFDTSYRKERPLKVFGGQHRIKSICEALKKGVCNFHGLRVYFDLTVEQKYDIATVNNTSIAVSGDLIDRMQEELLGSELRDWCQKVGLLEKGQNFADRRSPAGIVSVRVARTLIVNFHNAKNAKKDDFHAPIVCTTGTGVDERYKNVRETIDWADEKLKTMGLQFSRLHKTQRERVLCRKTDKFIEYANKAIHPSVSASWSFAAGLFQSDEKHLTSHYALADLPGPTDDPLNAKALSQARLKGIDPDTYRGLGARISSEELGRMLSLFILQATVASKRGVNLKLANVAIKNYHAVKTSFEAKKALKSI